MTWSQTRSRNACSMAFDPIVRDTDFICLFAHVLWLPLAIFEVSAHSFSPSLKPWTIIIVLSRSLALFMCPHFNQQGISRLRNSGRSDEDTLDARICSCVRTSFIRPCCCASRSRCCSSIIHAVRHGLHITFGHLSLTFAYDLLAFSAYNGWISKKFHHQSHPSLFCPRNTDMLTDQRGFQVKTDDMMQTCSLHNLHYQNHLHHVCKLLSILARCS